MSAADKLAKLREAATPGPWQRAKWGPIITKAWLDFDEGTGPRPQPWTCIYGPGPDLACIVPLVNATPQLIALIEAAESQIEVAEMMLAFLRVFRPDADLSEPAAQKLRAALADLDRALERTSK